MGGFSIGCCPVGDYSVESCCIGLLFGSYSIHRRLGSEHSLSRRSTTEMLWDSISPVLRKVQYLGPWE